MTAADTAADAYDRLPDAVTDLFGADATATYAYDLLTVDVPAASWTAALETARDELGCTYFDWLSAVDEPGTGFRVCAHVAALGEGRVRRLLVRTTVPHEAPVLPSAVGVYAGAAWHERETHEMFGVGFEGHPHLVPLLLPESFEGHPLRKDFVLAARVAKAWPGAKEPGESEHGGPKRRTMLPPGVPDPNEWGPLKGQLPPAPARPARGARAAGDRPARRTRSVSEGSAAQRPAAAPDASGASGAGAGASGPGAGSGVDASGAGAGAGASGAGAMGSGAGAGATGAAETAEAVETPRTAPPRRNRSASQGSASQTPGPTAPAGTDAGVSGTGTDAARNGTGADAGSGTGAARARRAAGSTDAPWHDPRPAFEPPAGQTEKQPPRKSEAGAEAENLQRPPEAEPAPKPGGTSRAEGTGTAPREPKPAPKPEAEPKTEGSGGPDGGTGGTQETAGTVGTDGTARTDETARTARTDETAGTDGADAAEKPARPESPTGPERPAGPADTERPAGPADTVHSADTEHPDRATGGDTA
ncbi:NADH-quinone oxidoreductase subunit C [Streptomyces sp. NPDC001741]|uniref:NADH-quinone oxidoreductase subunit C n=1 Tax=Streptomyces sp. NPDC001741 TaxID=3364605 RepID=UPI0036AAB4EC